MFTFVGFFIYLSARTVLVATHYKRAINIIYSYNNYRKLAEQYLRDPGPDIRVILDIRKWTFNQFFPGLETYAVLSDKKTKK